jgi:RNA polymerase sigma factor FliA
MSEFSSQLWENYQADPSKENRDALILDYMNLVKYVASKVGQGLPQNVEQSDLVSYGTFGLIDAIERFDLDRGFKFETFAISRIRGAMLDELRGMDWVPRSVRAKARAVDNAAQELEGSLHRNATTTEMASSLGVSERQYLQTIGQVSSSGLVGLDDSVQSSSSLTVGDTIADRAGDTDQFWEMQDSLASSIEAMPLRERVVLTLYYYENYTLADIGTVLGVTESRVCQIHTKAIEHLQDQMQTLGP